MYGFWKRHATQCYKRLLFVERVGLVLCRWVGGRQALPKGVTDSAWHCCGIERWAPGQPAARGSPWNQWDLSNMCWALGGHSEPGWSWLLKAALDWDSLAFPLHGDPLFSFGEDCSSSPFQCASACHVYPLAMRYSRQFFKTPLAYLFKRHFFFPFLLTFHIFLCWLQGEWSRANSISQAGYYVW